MQLDKLTEQVLNQIDTEGFEQKGAFSLRENGKSLCYGSSENISISRKKEKP